jgi:acyl carrier protein
MKRAEIVQAARTYLAEEFPNRAAEIAALDEGAPLFELGLVDSLSFLGLVTDLETRFDISVPASDFNPERFRTLDAIAAYVVGAGPAA